MGYEEDKQEVKGDTSKTDLSKPPPIPPSAPVTVEPESPTVFPEGNGPRAHHAQRNDRSGNHSAPLMSFEDVVESVLAGDFGEGNVRTHKLRGAGYSVLKVEAEVQRRQAAGDSPEE